ncbi:MAG: tetratricopeptide repeat protein, partial [Treponema sp.]|nr:tetratricopeptide repeat protein [Treponema sp.]
MPSLHDLEEFKTSFYSLGNEDETRAELELPRDDLVLPENGPETGFDTEMMANGMPEAGEPFPGTGETGIGAAESDFMDLGDLLGSMDNGLADDSEEQPPPSQEDIDFGSFIDSIPDSILDGSPDDTLDGIPGGIPDDRGSADNQEEPSLHADQGKPDNSAEDTDSFNLPPDLLDGFADEIEAEQASPFNGDIDDQDIGNLEMENLPPFDSSDNYELLKEDPAALTGSSGETEDEFFNETGAAESYGEAEPVGETVFEDYDDLDLNDLNFTIDKNAEDNSGGAEKPSDFPEEENPPETGNGIEELFGEDAAFDNIETANETGEADFSGDDDNFDMGGEVSDFDSYAVLEEIPGDSFDNFKLDANTLAGNFNLGKGAEDLGDDFSNLEEFSLPGIDSVFDGASAPAKASIRSGGRGRTQAAADEVEEINLSEEELEQFENTLSSYPLNLRIACEELIAEQAVAPDLMFRLVKLLVNGAPAAETAELAGQILGRTIPIPKGSEKQTGEALEAEQTSFSYIFIHNFLPVFRLFLIIALVLLSVGYLAWRFIYTPIKAESIYKLGYERIASGEYSRANERFLEAYKIQVKEVWFYKYARAFRDARQYTLAEEKYQQLLSYTSAKNKRNIPEKAAVLEYADMETNVIGNYQNADTILRHNLLDFYPNDRDALLALGDNSLAWGEFEPSHLEDAREYYARYMERYGRTDPLLERMLKYFIRTDNLGEVLPLQSYFMASSKRIISASTLAELGGYLLDKRYEKVQGVPDGNLDSIGGIRNILLRAIRQDSKLPESYYHLARYYRYYGNAYDERLTLDLAVRVFDAAKEGSAKRIRYHIQTLGRYSEVLINNREFFPAEENLLKGINLYQDGLSRRLLTRSPEFGRMYADLGDLEYFVKDGDMQSALDYYNLGEQNGYAPPEIQYRMGAAYYQLSQWGPAQDRIMAAFRDMPLNRRILYALGNVSYMRGNYFAAQAYYDRLLEILEADRSRLPPITASDDEKQQDLAERLMVAQNNMGVTLEALT